MQASLRDLWEVVVLVVVAHIVSEAVEGAVVGVCLLALHTCTTAHQNPATDVVLFFHLLENAISLYSCHAHST